MNTFKIRLACQALRSLFYNIPFLSYPRHFAFHIASWNGQGNFLGEHVLMEQEALKVVCIFLCCPDEEGVALVYWKD